MPILRVSTKCSICNKEKLDVYGDHGVMCGWSNDRISRHNNLVATIESACSAAALHPKREPQLLMANGLRPDLLLTTFSLARDAILDIAVTCPTQDKYIMMSASKPLFAANTYAATVKDNKYTTAAQIAGVDFYAMVVETTGGWCESATIVINKLTKLLAAREEEPLPKIRLQVYQQLSVCLQRANSIMILKRLPHTDWHPDL